MRQVKVAALSLALVAIPSIISTAQAAENQTDPCEMWERQIEQINETMRRGYSARDGEYLREQLREAQDRYRQCRNEHPKP